MKIQSQLLFLFLLSSKIDCSEKTEYMLHPLSKDETKIYVPKQAAKEKKIVITVPRHATINGKKVPLDQKKIVAGYSAALEESDPVILSIESTKTLGLKLILPEFMQISVVATGKSNIARELIDSPQKLLDNNLQKDYQKMAAEKKVEPITPLSFSSYEDRTATNPFWIFDECSCIDRAIRTQFSSLVSDHALTVLQSAKNSTLVYTSFASGGLFSDLYNLTLMILRLKAHKIDTVNIRVNLIDPWIEGPAQEFIKMLKDMYHKDGGIKFLTSGPIKKIDEFTSQRNEYTNYIYRLSQFLRFFNYTFDGVSLELYIYPKAQDYVYDCIQNRVPLSDIIMAVDYYIEAEGDLSVLVAQGSKNGGYLASLNTFKDNDVMAEDEENIQKTEKKFLKKYPAAKKFEKALQEHKLVKEKEAPELAHIVISKKIRDISADQFNNLIKGAKGDLIKIARLFRPLFYTPDQLTLLKYQEEKMRELLHFNVLDYFQIVLSKNEVLPEHVHEDQMSEQDKHEMQKIEDDLEDIYA